MAKNTFRRSLLCALGLVILGAGDRRLRAQAEPAGLGPGTYLNLGITPSLYQAQYGHQQLAGGSIYLDANPYRRLGGEVEYRTLRYHASEGIRQSTLLAGPRLSVKLHRFRPYAKLLVGRGDFRFPFDYARGSYFALAPGAGLDWTPRKGRFTVRVVDVEYQYWPGFSFGPITPYGYSSGLALRLF
jgi:hypothetical protein